MMEGEKESNLAKLDMIQIICQSIVNYIYIIQEKI